MKEGIIDNRGVEQETCPTCNSRVLLNFPSPHCLLCNCHNLSFLVRHALLFLSLLQFQVAGLYLRAGGEQSDGAAAHDPEPGLPSYLVHAAALVPGSFDAGSAGLVPEPHQIPSHVSVGQQ